MAFPRRDARMHTAEAFRKLLMLQTQGKYDRCLRSSSRIRPRVSYRLLQQEWRKFNCWFAGEKDSWFWINSVFVPSILMHACGVYFRFSGFCELMFVVFSFCLDKGFVSINSDFFWYFYWCYKRKKKWLFAFEFSWFFLVFLTDCSNRRDKGFIINFEVKIRCPGKIAFFFVILNCEVMFDVFSFRFDKTLIFYGVQTQIFWYFYW